MSAGGRSAAEGGLGRSLATTLDADGDGRRVDRLRRFAEAAGFDLQFDADGQAVLHTGLYLDPHGDVAHLQAPCVNPPRDGGSSG